MPVLIPPSALALVLSFLAALPSPRVAAQLSLPDAIAIFDRQVLIGALRLDPDAKVVVAAGDIARCTALNAAVATAALVEAIVEAAGAAVVITAGVPRSTSTSAPSTATPPRGRAATSASALQDGTSWR